MDINLVLPTGWKSSVETLHEPAGPVKHLEAYCADGSEIDICVGPMPPESTAEEEAFLNYADMVGWDDDDPEDEAALTVWTFNNRKAWGFEALCEDDSPLRVICSEVRGGVLLVMSIVAPDEKKLEELFSYLEARLRIK